MIWKRMVTEIGMGTDIRGEDQTKAAIRALKDALWHNSLGLAELVGSSSDAMRVEITIGVPRPEEVKKSDVLSVLPHGNGTIQCVEGGLEIPHPTRNTKTLIANAAAVVYLHCPDKIV